MKDEIITGTVVAMIGLSLGFVAGTVMNSYYKAAIIDHGAAHWTVDNRGHTEFVWNDGGKGLFAVPVKKVETNE